MRTSLVFLLLASAAVPAFAAQGDEERTSRREAREEARADRQAEPQAERAQRPERSEPEAQDRSFEPRHEDRPQIVQQQAEVVQERVVETSTSRRSGGDSARPAFEQRIVQSESSHSAEPPRPAMDQRRDSPDSVREWRRHERNADNAPAAIEQQVAPADNAREWRGRERRVGDGSADNQQSNGTLGNGAFREPRREPTGRDSIGNRRGPMFGGIPRQGTQPPLPNSSQQATANQLSRVSAQHWRNNWRSDHHYDWQNHRHRHGSLFHLGFYFDPFGWGYQRYSIGSRLWPNYYRSSYWLNDPWQYRLPYAPPGYRWIRYYDDAVLVDTWDGQVVDVIYNFFW